MARHRADVSGDDEWVTQLIFDGSPPVSKPRPQDTDGLSVLAGRLTVAEAARWVRRGRLPFPRDSVRHARIADLREAGFTVTSTPSRPIPIHVSITREAEWGEDGPHRFDECFEPSSPDEAVIQP